MRIIAGRFRSRKLRTPAGLATRPTPDRLRETLFSIIAPEIEGSVFLDAYAGSGAVGFEALSRGAKQIILLESNTAALEIIRENIAALQVEGEVTVGRGKAQALIQRYHFSLCFLDPPYEMVGEYEASLTAISQSNCRLAVAQHSSRIVLPEQFQTLNKTRVLRQGDNSLSFYLKKL